MQKILIAFLLSIVWAHGSSPQGIEGIKPHRLEGLVTGIRMNCGVMNGRRVVLKDYKQIKCSCVDSVMSALDYSPTQKKTQSGAGAVTKMAMYSMKENIVNSIVERMSNVYKKGFINNLQRKKYLSQEVYRVIVRANNICKKQFMFNKVPIGNAPNNINLLSLLGKKDYETFRAILRSLVPIIPEIDDYKTLKVINNPLK